MPLPWGQLMFFHSHHWTSPYSQLASTPGLTGGQALRIVGSLVTSTMYAHPQAASMLVAGRGHRTQTAN